MNPFDSLFDGIDAGVEALFSIPNIALWFAFGLLGWCAWIIVYNYRRHYAPLSRQLSDRLEVTRFIAEADDDAEAQRGFAVAFAQVDAAMSAGGPGASGLRHAWRQFRGTLLDTQETPLCATARRSMREGAPQAGLIWVARRSRERGALGINNCANAPRGTCIVRRSVL